MYCALAPARWESRCRERPNFACKGGHLTAWHLADVLDHCERMRALRQEALVAEVDDDSDREPVDDGRCNGELLGARSWLLPSVVCASKSGAVSLIAQAVGSGLSDLGVLMRLDAGHTDRADDLAAGHDRHAAFGDACAERQHAKAHAAAGDRILEHLSRAPKLGRRARLLLGDADRRELRVVEPLQHHEVGAGIDDSDGDAPVVLGRRRLRPRPSPSSRRRCRWARHRACWEVRLGPCASLPYAAAALKRGASTVFFSVAAIAVISSRLSGE